jgi:hypothetical protein
MADQSSLPCWTLSVPTWCYLLQCALATVLIRVVIFIFRASAMVRGDISRPSSEQPPPPVQHWTFWPAFWESFRGYGRDRLHADLWLNAWIGLFDLAAYPVLIKTGHLEVIGAWLAVRTAGAWGGWQSSRTSFNRFLLSNILELFISYFWLMPYVSGCSTGWSIF